MKSILQEANSIERAIDKAWNQAGKPKEFTIKVLDEGERNFLGLSRRPAIVTILYKPEKVTSQSTVQQRSKEDRPPREHDRRERPVRNQEAPRRNDAEQRPRRYVGTDEQRTAFNTAKNEGWTDEWRDYVVSEIRELLKHMGVSVDLDAQVTADKVLTISFNQAILDNEDEQRMLFATLSYLAIQLLKRMYKSRFVGYRIAVTGPKADGSSMSADSDEPLPRNAYEPRGSHNRREAAPQQVQQPREESGPRPERASRDRGERPERTGDREQRSGDRDRRPRRDRPSQPRPAQSQQYASDHATSNLDSSDDIVADQIRFAQQQLSKEEKKSSASATPLKKDTKYQPFFVIEDEVSGK